MSARPVVAPYHRLREEYEEVGELSRRRADCRLRCHFVIWLLHGSASPECCKPAASTAAGAYADARAGATPNARTRASWRLGQRHHAAGLGQRDGEPAARGF